MIDLGRVDRDSDTPVFKQIAAALREAILSGRIPPGGKVPSETQLRGHFGVARMTVRQALSELSAEGLTVSEHGLGVFVRQFSEEVRIRPATAEERRLLKIPSGVPVRSVRRVLFDRDGEPSGLTETIKLATRS